MPDSSVQSADTFPALAWVAGLTLLLAKRWLLVLVVWSLVILGGVVFAYLPQPMYKATAVLAPVKSTQNMSSLASLAGQFGGIGSLASLVGLGDGDELNGVAHLKSRKFVTSFIQEKSLLPVLFPDQWDRKKGTWRADLDPDDVPTMDDAWELFDRRIRLITEDQKTGLVTLSITWKDPALAAQWANELAARVNSAIRHRAIATADASLKALKVELDQTAPMELRNAIYSLMEGQIQAKILANSRPEFAFAVIDPATAPDADRIASPARLMLLVMSFVGGFVLAVLVAVLVEAGHWNLRAPKG